jgi:tripartite-type tricarboxylate transporter receptor subunit TctC
MIRTLVWALAIFSLSRALQAQAQPDWPSRPLRIIVAFAAGSFTDVAARSIGRELTEQLGQQVIVENRLGAGGTLGTNAAARATPDGYTLLLFDNSFAIWPALYAKLPFNPVRDFAQVSLVADSPSMLVTRLGFPAKTVRELVDLARAKPGELTFGTAGQGSTAHLASELFLGIAGVKMTHVPFKGVALAIADVVAGRIDISIAGLASGMAQVRGGRVHGLAVSGKERSTVLPDVPTFAEAGFPDYRMIHVWGVAVPAATPRGLVSRLNLEVARALDKPRLKELFLGQGARAMPSSPAELSRRIGEEMKMWNDVIVRNAVKVE